MTLKSLQPFHDSRSSLNAEVEVLFAKGLGTQDDRDRVLEIRRQLRHLDAYIATLVLSESQAQGSADAVAVSEPTESTGDAVTVGEPAESSADAVVIGEPDQPAENTQE